MKGLCDLCGENLEGHDVLAVRDWRFFGGAPDDANRAFLELEYGSVVTLHRHCVANYIEGQFLFLHTDAWSPDEQSE